MDRPAHFGRSGVSGEVLRTYRCEVAVGLKPVLGIALAAGLAGSLLTVWVAGILITFGLVLLVVWPDPPPTQDERAKAALDALRGLARDYPGSR